MTKAATIDERDLREACTREFPGLYERLTIRIREAQLSREYEAMRLEVDRLIAVNASLAGQGRHHEYLANADRIDALWKRMDSNMDERFPSSARGPRA